MTTTTGITEGTKYVTETLVTDTLTYEILSRTEKTITIRTMLWGDVLRKQDGGCGLPQVWFEAVPDPDGRVYTLRLRKDGTYRLGRSAHALRPALMIDGKPTTFTDYSY